MPDQGHGNKHTGGVPPLCWVLTGVSLTALLALWGLLLSTRLLPTLYLILALAAELLVAGLVFFLAKNPKHLVLTAGSCLLTLLVLAGSVMGGFYLWRTIQMVQAVSSVALEHSRVSLYVMEDSAAESLEDMTVSVTGILKELDRANTDTALEKIEADYGMKLAVKEFDTLIQLAEALQDGKVDAILLNESFLTLYEETPGYQDFPALLRAISSSRVDHVIKVEPSEPAKDTDPIINVLLSGSDTRNDTIDQRGRSDVNIIASINTETNQILLISTPRDYYLPLDVGAPDAYDKLTHAGIYGMDVLTGTLENLYGIDIDYYFRINFTGFVNVIDALGGIEVYSAYDFTAEDYHYVQGMNSLNGEEALVFARERYSFAEGDRQRGNNQMEVLKAAFRKATNPAILTQYLTILNSVESCVDTNIPYDVISAQVRRQLSSGDTWTIESFSVDGTDSHATTYSMNQNLYVMIPNEASVAEAREKLAAMGNEIRQEGLEEQEPQEETLSEPAA